MRVTVVRSGGVAGMVQTTTVDLADLPPESAADLRGAVAACTFTPPDDLRPSRTADGFAFEVVVVDDDGAEQRVRFGQGRAPAGVDALVGRVTDCPQSRRRLGR